MTISARTAFMTGLLLWQRPAALHVGDMRFPRPQGRGGMQLDCRRLICQWEFGPRYSFAVEVTGPVVRCGGLGCFLRFDWRVERQIFTVEPEVFLNNAYDQGVIFALRQAGYGDGADASGAQKYHRKGAAVG